MLDLKSKLLAAGLVTQEQVNRVEQEKQERKQRKHQLHSVQKTPKSDAITDDDFETKQRAKQLETLKSLPKNEQYALIRRWVERNKLDKETSVLTENSEKYFFHKACGSVTWLTVEKEVHQKIVDGEAAIMAYMSNHGLTHCVVPRDIAEDVAEVFPYWLRALTNHVDAGKIDPMPPKKNKDTAKLSEV